MTMKCIDCRQTVEALNDAQRRAMRCPPCQGKYKGKINSKEWGDIWTAREYNRSRDRNVV